MTETIAARRARVRSARLLERPMTLRNTLYILKYIGDVDQPEQEHGGFHEQTIQAARSALLHLRRLRKQLQRAKHRRSNAALTGAESVPSNGVVGG